MLYWLKQCDFLSQEIKITVNSGDSRVKTIFGGAWSVLSIIFSIFFVIYFFVNFITNTSIKIITSRETSPFLNLGKACSVPIWLRLSDNNGVPYDNPNQIYKIQMKYFYGGSNTTVENTEQTSYFIPIEKCDRDKHLGEYADLFNDIHDLDTFYCLTKRASNETWYGIYGGIKPFGYFHFYISQCVNDTAEVTCLGQTEINSILARTYFEFRTIDYDIDNYKKGPDIPILKSERHMASNTASKRIWMYFKIIQYITDSGVLFESEEEKFFFQFENYSTDIDFRNNMEYYIQGTFVEFTMLWSSHLDIYKRQYWKLQDYFATIGGLLTFIINCAYLLNYFVSQNSFFIYLINNHSKKKVILFQPSKLGAEYSNSEATSANAIASKGDSVKRRTSFYGQSNFNKSLKKDDTPKGSNAKLNNFILRTQLKKELAKPKITQEHSWMNNTSSNSQKNTNTNIMIWTQLNESKIQQTKTTNYDCNSFEELKIPFWHYWTPVYLCGEAIKSKRQFIEQCKVINEKWNIMTIWESMHLVNQIKEIIERDNQKRVVK